MIDMRGNWRRVICWWRAYHGWSDELILGDHQWCDTCWARQTWMPELRDPEFVTGQRPTPSMLPPYAEASGVDGTDPGGAFCPTTSRNKRSAASVWVAS